MKDQKYVVSGVSVKELKAAGVDCSKTSCDSWLNYLIENMVMVGNTDFPENRDKFLSEGAIYIGSDLSRLKQNEVMNVRNEGKVQFQHMSKAEQDALEAAGKSGCDVLKNHGKWGSALVLHPFTLHTIYRHKQPTVNEESAPTVEAAITARISAHEAELDGLYSEADLEVMRPIWRENILTQVFDFIEDGARV